MRDPRAGTLTGVRRWLDPNEIRGELGRASRFLAPAASATNVRPESEQTGVWPSRMTRAGTRNGTHGLGGTTDQVPKEAWRQ